jgi:IclR family acetate operon transcriptional repressor
MRAARKDDGAMADLDAVRRRKAPEAPEEDSSTGIGEDQFTVRSLARGLRVLTQFTMDRPHWSLTELARASGLHKATTYRITRTMETERFLAFDPVTGTYHLGPAMIPVSYLAQAHTELARMAQPFLDRLAQETGETSNLGVEVEGNFLVIGQVLTSHVFKPTLPVGRVLSDLANAHGKVFTAFKPAKERAAVLSRPLPRPTANAKTDRAEIIAELDRIAEEGVAYDLEENGASICAIGAPVYGKNASVIATLAVVAPAERFDEARKQRYTEVVKRVAAEFSTYLGYSPS